MNALLRRCNVRRLRSWRDLHVTAPVATFDLRKIELTPLEQRKLTFDSHNMVTELESSGFEKRQAELIVSALVTLTTANMDIVYKDMVTKAHQEIALQQIMAHLDSIRKDMVILEKSEFANLRSENTEETLKIRAETKLDINLENSRISDMVCVFVGQVLHSLHEFGGITVVVFDGLVDDITRKPTWNTTTWRSARRWTAGGFTQNCPGVSQMETIRYLAATVFSCLAIALGVYRFWR
ncbi:Coiled-coil domain-containing protein 90B, mitochondrial Precursor [Larimichthys crocea]|uniref:Coiled-coil domain-containing protein 90B, mitochondrial n=1 Tax=Larimichthys crocea TaxID=215358 RepID=A0A6G0I8I8_LARCR|nr:Coiled-coil domain-containing protein 90B, mitochondrial Precursor [Larimichthys crocea]